MRNAIAVMALMAMLSGQAVAREGAPTPSVDLQVKRVTVAQGAETLAEADRARPGDRLAYRATFNGGKEGVSQGVVTLPIPPGTTLDLARIRPAGALASLDGKAFSPIPLKRQRLVDGIAVTEEVPAAEYRFVRWNLGAVAADGQAHGDIQVVVNQK